LQVCETTWFGKAFKSKARKVIVVSCEEACLKTLKLSPMKKMTLFWTCWMLFLLPNYNVLAQRPDTLKKYQSPRIGTILKAPFIKSKIVRATIVPAILIGYGMSTTKDHGIYSSYDIRRDILRRHSNFSTGLDNPLLIAPYLELAAVNFLSVRSNNDLVNTSLLILKAEAMMSTMVFGLKALTRQERPDGSDKNSMPSGHTAQAFLAASILHSELRYKSQWYGVGAYTIATSVGAIRMLKNKHWESDVFVGAGIGILSSHLSYLTHRNRWGRQPFTLVPAYQFGTPTIGLSIDLSNLKKHNQAAAMLRPGKQSPIADISSDIK
jgi:membrane-associated phospholipid phosphatase